MSHWIDGLQILEQGLGGVPHTDTQHPLIVPGALNGEKSQHSTEPAVHVRTARRMPAPAPAASHLNRALRPELRKAPFAAAASADPTATSVSARWVCSSRWTRSRIASANTTPS